ncbi:MAG: amidohydrolase family protein [Clostridia bacterium]|nr:amidohydrolase family protein [Clostridia bacterium]
MENVRNVKKIDVHAHATPYKSWICPYQTGQAMVNDTELLSFYDQLGIGTGVLLPLVAPDEACFQIPPQEAKLLSEKHPERFVWFCNIDPRMAGNNPKADFSKMLNFYKALGARGVGEMTSNLPVDDPLMENLFYHCAECDMPVTIHIAPACEQYNYYGIKDDLGLPRLEKMLKKYPKLKIFGHSQLFWAEISADVTEESRTGYPKGKITEGRLAQLLRECPNLYCDVSAGSGMNALRRDPEYTAKFFEEFSDRLMYGLDICGTSNKHPFEYEEMLNRYLDEGVISEEHYYKFVRGNAERLLNIK